MGWVVVLLLGCTLAEAFVSTNVLPRNPGMPFRQCILRKPLRQVMNTLDLLKTSFLPIYSGKLNTQKSLGGIMETEATLKDKISTMHATIVTMNATIVTMNASIVTMNATIMIMNSTIQSLKAEIKANTDKYESRFDSLQAEHQAMIKILTNPQTPQFDSEITAALNVLQAASKRTFNKAPIANTKISCDEFK
jgi:peptidoglycan hydrolase CwlO-like protein